MFLFAVSSKGLISFWVTSNLLLTKAFEAGRSRFVSC